MTIKSVSSFHSNPAFHSNSGTPPVLSTQDFNRELLARHAEFKRAAVSNGNFLSRPPTPYKEVATPPRIRLTREIRVAEQPTSDPGRFVASNRVAARASRAIGPNGSGVPVLAPIRPVASQDLARAALDRIHIARQRRREDWKFVPTPTAAIREAQERAAPRTSVTVTLKFGPGRIPRGIVDAAIDEALQKKAVAHLTAKERALLGNSIARDACPAIDAAAVDGELSRDFEWTSFYVVRANPNRVQPGKPTDTNKSVDAAHAHDATPRDTAHTSQPQFPVVQPRTATVTPQPHVSGPPAFPAFPIAQTQPIAVVAPLVKPFVKPLVEPLMEPLVEPLAPSPIPQAPPFPAFLLAGTRTTTTTTTTTATTKTPTIPSPFLSAFTKPTSTSTSTSASASTKSATPTPTNTPTFHSAPTRSDSPGDTLGVHPRVTPGVSPGVTPNVTPSITPSPSQLTSRPRHAIDHLVIRPTALRDSSTQVEPSRPIYRFYSQTFFMPVSPSALEDYRF